MPDRPGLAELVAEAAKRIDSGEHPTPRYAGKNAEAVEGLPLFEKEE